MVANSACATITLSTENASILNNNSYIGMLLVNNIPFAD